jgi:hypothetical protein
MTRLFKEGRIRIKTRINPHVCSALPLLKSHSSTDSLLPAAALQHRPPPGSHLPHSLREIDLPSALAMPNKNSRFENHEKQNWRACD